MKTRTLTALQLVALTAQIILAFPGSDADGKHIVDKDTKMIFMVLSDQDSTVELLYLDPQQSGEIAEATVPSKVTDEETGKAYTVVSINSNQFNLDTLKKITIPNTVTHINIDAFDGQSQLTDIKVEEGSNAFRDIDGVLYTADSKTLVRYPMGRTQTEYSVDDATEYFGQNSFNGCKSIQTISVKQIHSVERYAFHDCESLGTGPMNTQFEYRNTEPTIKHISTSQFSGCSGLTSFQFGTLEDIGPYQFTNCYNLTVVNLPETLIYIDATAFSFTPSGADPTKVPKLSAINVQVGNPFYSSYDGVLIDDTTHALICYPAGKEDETFSIPDTVISLQKQSFRYNTHLKVLKYPLSLVFIDEYQLQDCTSLQTFDYEVNSKLYSVGDYAFSGCINLQNVTLDGVAYIGSHAFNNCASLDAMTIPSSVLSIGEYAFYKCTNLKMFVASNLQGYYQIDGVLFLRNQSTHSSTLTLICYPPQRMSDGKVITEYTLPTDTIWVNAFAFDEQPLKTLTLSKNMSAIDEYAFAGMSSLVTVDLCGSIIRIGNSQFENCSKLTTIKGAQSVTTIESWQFIQCTSLKELPSMPALKSIGAFSFNQTALVDVVLPTTIESIGAGAFGSTGQLKSLEIEASNVDLDPQAFLSIGMVDESTLSDVVLKCHKSLLKDYVGTIPENVDVKYYEDREFPKENIIGIVVCAILLLIIANSFRRI